MEEGKRIIETKEEEKEKGSSSLKLYLESMSLVHEVQLKCLRVGQKEGKERIHFCS